MVDLGATLSADKFFWRKVDCVGVASAEGVCVRGEGSSTAEVFSDSIGETGLRER
jgi:hypothetical protein